jgi:isoleucyl-tRNA synthetase
VVESEGALTIALDPALTPALRREGLARELVNRIQRLRKDSGLEVSDRIRVAVAGAEELLEAVRAFEAFIAAETLARQVTVVAGPVDAGAHPYTREVDLDGVAGEVGIALANPGTV